MPTPEIHRAKQILESRSILGRTTVLILSSYLVGISSCHYVVQGLQTYTLLAGICGVIGFCGCDFVARRREQRAMRDVYERVAIKLERFKERELHSEPKSGEHAAIPVSQLVDSR